MSAAGLTLILGGVLSLACLVGVGVLFWFALRRPPQRDPACAKCGYQVQGLETMSCPECGSDLREVGIRTPRGQMLHPALFVLLYTVLLVLPALVFFGAAMRFGPSVAVTTASFGLRPIDDVYLPVQIDQSIVSLTFGRPTGVMSATGISGVDGETVTNTITFPRVMGATIRSRTIDVRTLTDVDAMRPAQLSIEVNGAPPDPVDAPALDAVFGEDSGPEWAKADVDELAALLTALARGDATSPTARLAITAPNMISTTPRMPTWYPATVIAVGVLLYIAGLVVYFVRRRKRLAAKD